MKVHFEKLVDVCKILLIFITLTIFFYGLILWIMEKVEPNQRFESPKGKAVKVFYTEEQPTIHNIHDFTNRLFFYYWFGE